MLFAGLPDAMFLPAGGFPLQNLVSICQVTETYPADTAHQSDFSMMDTAAPSTVTVISGTGAITLLPNSRADATFAGPWNENVNPTVDAERNCGSAAWRSYPRCRPARLAGR